MTTQTITPDTLGRPITAEDVQEGDRVQVRSTDGYTPFSFVWKSGDDIGTRLVITSITRPVPDVPEQPALPTEPGHYVPTDDLLGDPWLLDEKGQWHFVGYPQSPKQAWIYAPFTRLVPAGSAGEAAVREAALREAAAIAGKGSSSREVHPVNRAERKRIRKAILALVPEAEGEKA